MRTTTMPKRPFLEDIPGRLPHGTRYVIEGRRSKNGHLKIVSRQVILPTGEHLDIAGPPAQPKKPAGAARRKATRRRG